MRSDSPPTLAISLRAVEDAVEQRQARAVIGLALRLGESLLSTGASASDVVATVLRLTDAYGLRSCHVDVTFTSISVSYHRGLDHDPMNVMRVVTVRSADFTRLEALQALVRSIVEDPMDVEVARERLDDIVRAPHPYRRWLVTVALGVLGAAVAALFGGGAAMMVVSAVTVAVVDRVQRFLARRGLAAFFTQAVGAAIPTIVAVLLYAAISHRLPGTGGLSPSLVVVAGIIVMMAGLSVVGAAQDAIDGYYVTAGARIFEVLILTLGVVVGILAVLALAHRLGVPMNVSPDVHVAPSYVLQIVAAMAVTASFALSSYTGARTAAIAVATAGVGWLVFVVAVDLEFAASAASAMAALTIGILSQLVSRRLRVPSLAVTTAGIVPLLPGLMVYRGLFQLVEGAQSSDLGTGLTTLFGAAGVGIGLAAGVSMGTFLARPTPSSLDRGQRRALRRSVGDARE